MERKVRRHGESLVIFVVFVLSLFVFILSSCLCPLSITITTTTTTTLFLVTILIHSLHHYIYFVSEFDRSKRHTKMTEWDKIVLISSVDVDASFFLQEHVERKLQELGVVLEHVVSAGKYWADVRKTRGFLS
jgi:hypothetical protein